MEFTPLEPGRVPSLDDITGPQALYYVAEMLTYLVNTHEHLKNGPQGRKMSGDRKPSFSVASLEANLVAQALQGSHEQALEDDSDEPEDSIASGSDRVALYGRFWLKSIPPISIHEYTQRFHKYCRSSVATYLAAGRYLYMMCVENRTLPITRNNVFRLFAASYMIAAKVVEDVLYPFKRYATTAGLKVEDLSKLELSFIFLAESDFKIDAGLLWDSLNSWCFHVRQS